MIWNVAFGETLWSISMFVLLWTFVREVMNYIFFTYEAFAYRHSNDIIRNGRY